MHFFSPTDFFLCTVGYIHFGIPPTLTHSTNLVDALRKSRVEYIAMLGTTKQTMSASTPVVVGASVGISASVVALAILIIVGVLLLITGGGPPI
jgi:ABC-type uncharacterized transport system permease subunit